MSQLQQPITPNVLLNMSRLIENCVIPQETLPDNYHFIDYIKSECSKEEQQPPSAPRRDEAVPTSSPRNDDNSPPQQTYYIMPQPDLHALFGSDIQTLYELVEWRTPRPAPAASAASAAAASQPTTSNHNQVLYSIAHVLTNFRRKSPHDNVSPDVMYNSIRYSTDVAVRAPSPALYRLIHDPSSNLDLSDDYLNYISLNLSINILIFNKTDAPLPQMKYYLGKDGMYDPFYMTLMFYSENGRLFFFKMNNMLNYYYADSDSTTTSNNMLYRLYQGLKPAFTQLFNEETRDVIYRLNQPTDAAAAAATPTTSGASHVRPTLKMTRDELVTMVVERGLDPEKEGKSGKKINRTKQELLDLLALHN